jgi:hypothetical protein
MNKISKVLKENNLILAFGGFALLIVGLAIVGAIRAYSPVPFWDMWDGTIEFFRNVNEGNHSAWWAQHNEHRILLARLLFWTDFKFFSGSNWFLIAFNYLLIGASAFLSYRLLRAAAATEKPATEEILLGLFMTAWLFLWMQNENLTWGFQSQFILAQLLPLCALYWLHKSVSGIHINRHFLIACGFGLASAGTMANGVLALPLMTLYALVTRQNPVRIGVLLSLSAAALFLYFHDYQSPARHSSFSQTLKENPFGVLQYVLRYIGNPFFFLFGKEEFSKLMTYAAALFLIGSSIGFAIKSLRRPQENTLMLALLFFILYIGGTALGTAGGRLLFGLDQAFSSRYTTPTLMAWAALLVLYSPSILAVLRTKNTIVLLSFAWLALPMAILQLGATQSQDVMLFERKMAALALELQVKDEKQINNIYPDAQRALDLALKASVHNFSIFGQYPFLDAREQLGVSVQQPALPDCQGNLDTVANIEGDKRFVRVSGWIFDPAGKNYPEAIRFLGSEDKVVGYALTGQPRPDVANAIDKKALQAGYQGYLLADRTGTMITLQGENFSCQMRTTVPVPVFSLASSKPSTASVTLGGASVLPGNQWLGSDFYKSVIDGMQIYGSHIKSDADIGSISLRVKRGDRIFYRSGPTGGRQFLEIPDSTFPPVQLPVSTEWALLDLDGMRLPNGPFVIKLSDQGSDWGEWSALAVRQDGG